MNPQTGSPDSGSPEIIALLTDIKTIGYFTFGAIFILIGLLTLQLFFTGKGDD